MKGTAPRGETRDQDALNAQFLQSSLKNRAENLMVVDMIRNDLGKIAEVGSIDVPQLFEVEVLPTILQMTSTVEATVAPDIERLFAALFPCASIVGAPKNATMEIIRELESSPRGIYTGAIGWMAPDSRARFSVAIRTIVETPAADRIEYGVGSGIVWDSECEAEWEECLLKARALKRSSEPWSLLETMRWTPKEGFWLLDLHLERLERSAKDLGIPVDWAKLQNELEVEYGEPTRVRLLVDRSGKARFQSFPLPQSNPELRARLARRPVASADPALRYKTNRRGFYERHVLESGVDEALLWNERGEVTEFCNGNLVAVLDSKQITPPVECGLLEGTLRSQLIRDGEVSVQKVTLEDLPRVEKLFRVNSLRGWQSVNFLDPTN